MAECRQRGAGLIRRADTVRMQVRVLNRWPHVRALQRHREGWKPGALGVDLGIVAWSSVPSLARRAGGDRGSSETALSWR
jgi:hypothetical protein